VISVELPRVAHQRGEPKGLAAGAGAKVDDLLFGLCAREEGRNLRAFVLHLIPAFAVTRLCLDMRAASRTGSLQDADADRRMGCGLSIEAVQGLQYLVAGRLKRVDPEVDWGTFGQRRPLLSRP